MGRVIRVVLRPCIRPIGTIPNTAAAAAAISARLRVE
jgi:hypothetical protein